MKKLLLVLLCVFVANTSTFAQRGRASTSSQDDSQTAARSARSAAPARSARSAAPARSARSAAPARSARSAAPARSARSAAPARSARSAAGGSAVNATVATETAETNTARAATARQSRTGLSVKNTTTTTTVTASTTPATSVADALAAAGYASNTAAPVEKTTEEIASQIANENTCKEAYNKCMDDFCLDTDPESLMGRCLCSSTVLSFSAKETQRKQLVATINQMQDQINYLPLAKQKSQLDGTPIEESLKAVTLEQLKEKGLAPSTEDMGTTDIYDIYLGSSAKNTTQKEGDDLLKQAQTNCQTVLDVCPTDSRERVKGSYATLAGNSCRAYGRSIDAKLEELGLTSQKASRAFQAEALKYDLTTTNAMDSQQCSAELFTCMEADMICGAGFEKCYTDATLESLKQNCSSVLNKCQGANKDDAIWKTFKTIALARSQLSNQQCYEQSIECIANECGENWENCMTSGTVVASKVQERAKVACGDIVDRCVITVSGQGKKVTSASIWDTVINEIIRSGVEDSSETVVFNAVETCLANACGEGYANCKTKSAINMKKSACSAQLSRLANEETQNTVFNNLRDSILAQYGYTELECRDEVKKYMDSACGEGYINCADPTTAGSYMSAALSKATSMCEDWNTQAEVNGKKAEPTQESHFSNVAKSAFADIKNSIVPQGKQNKILKDIQDCQAKGPAYVWKAEQKTKEGKTIGEECGCAYISFDTKACMTAEEYTQELETRKVNAVNEAEVLRIEAEAEAARVKAAQELAAQQQEFDRVNAQKTCEAKNWVFVSEFYEYEPKDDGMNSITADDNYCCRYGKGANGCKTMEESKAECENLTEKSEWSNLEVKCCEKGVLADGKCFDQKAYVKWCEQNKGNIQGEDCKFAVTILGYRGNVCGVRTNRHETVTIYAGSGVFTCDDSHGTYVKNTCSKSGQRGCFFNGTRIGGFNSQITFPTYK